MTGSILLTGAAGFTGLHFTRAATERGYNVIALQSNITDARAIEQELGSRSIDYVVHLAAISAVTHADELEIYRVNLFGTLKLLDALSALDTPPKKVIVASSANIYGNAPISPIDESVAPAPTNQYAMSKLAMEHMSASYTDHLSLLTVRPFNYTGVGHDERFVVPKLVRHFRERQHAVELGNLDVQREFNDVRSTCHAYLALLNDGEPGETYNICSGQPYSLQDVITELEHLTGHSLEVHVNPAFVRPNEVLRLCGNPVKLERCIGALPRPELKDTLRWMLEADAH